MKKIFIALFSLVVIQLNAQTADEIIQNNAKAMGGLDNFNKIQSAKFTGTVTARGMDLPITVQIINGKAVRTDVEVMGQSITNVYKDGKGWKINPYAGAPSATEVTGNELNDFKTQSFLASQLMDYKARDCNVELAGQEDVDGVKTNKIKLTSADKKETTYFIDINNSMVIKTVSVRDMMGQEIQVETYYSDVKEFGGIKFFMSRVQKADGQVFQEIHFDKVELNVPVDEKIFNM